jgi:DNA polymerase-3 subunit beta
MTNKQAAAMEPSLPLADKPDLESSKQPADKKSSQQIRFSVQLEPLLRELQLLSPIAGDDKATTPITRNILIEADPQRNTLTLLTTNLETALQTEVPANIKTGGKTTVAAKDLLKIIKTVSSGNSIDFKTTKEKLVVSFDSTEFELPTIPADEYPALPTVNSTAAIQLPVELLQTAIKPVIFAITEQEMRYALATARMEIDGNMLQLVATDGHRLSYIAPRSNQELSKTKVETLIPKLALEQIEKLLVLLEEGEEIRFSTENNFGMFQLAQRTLIYRVIENQFPQFEKFILLKGDRKVTFDTAALKAALQKVTVLSDNRSRAAVFQVKSDTTIINWQKDTHRAKTQIPSTLQGEEIQVSFNPSYFLDFLKITDASEVVLEITGENSAAIMKPAGENNAQQLYVVMPMRV